MKRKRNNDTSIALEKLGKVARTCVILFPLLGLTWIIGFVSLAFSHVVLQYLFVILYSMQGMFLFVFNTWRWDEIREGIRMERRRRQLQYQINEAANRRKAAQENPKGPNNIQLQVISNEKNHIIEHDTKEGLPEPQNVEIAIRPPQHKKNDATGRSDDNIVMEGPDDPAAENYDKTATTSNERCNTNITAPPEKEGDEVKLTKRSNVNPDEHEEGKLNVPGGAPQREVPDASASGSAVFTRAAPVNRFLPTGTHIWMRVLKRRKIVISDPEKIEKIRFDSGDP